MAVRSAPAPQTVPAPVVASLRILVAGDNRETKSANGASQPAWTTVCRSRFGPPTFGRRLTASWAHAAGGAKRIRTARPSRTVGGLQWRHRYPRKAAPDLQRKAIELVTSSRAARRSTCRERPFWSGNLQRSLFGTSLLVARRLVEAGVTFVGVTIESRGAGHWEVVRIFLGLAGAVGDLDSRIPPRSIGVLPIVTTALF